MRDGGRVMFVGGPMHGQCMAVDPELHVFLAPVPKNPSDLGLEDLHYPDPLDCIRYKRRRVATMFGWYYFFEVEGDWVDTIEVNFWLTGARAWSYFMFYVERIRRGPITEWGVLGEVKDA